MVWKNLISKLDNGVMSDTKGKVNLLDTVPVQCGHITTEWEGEYAILSFPRFKYDWMRRFLLPVEEAAPEATVNVLVNNKADQSFQVQLAVSYTHL